MIQLDLFQMVCQQKNIILLEGCSHKNILTKKPSDLESDYTKLGEFAMECDPSETPVVKLNNIFQFGCCLNPKE